MRESSFPGLGSRAFCLAMVVAASAWGCSSGSPGSGTPDEDGAAVGDAGSAVDAKQLGDASPDPYMAYRATCLGQINQDRAMVGAAPLVLWAAGNACADDQARKGGDDFTASGMVTFHKYYGQCKEQYQNECWYSS